MRTRQNQPKRSPSVRAVRAPKPEKPVSKLYRDIWATVRRIPRGRVATYGQIATLSGNPGQPRLVGYAMHALPEGSSVPWHRVVNARGMISLRHRGQAGSGESLQRALLEKEGVRFDVWGRLDLEERLWRPRSLLRQAGDSNRTRGGRSCGYSAVMPAIPSRAHRPRRSSGSGASTVNGASVAGWRSVIRQACSPWRKWSSRARSSSV